MSVQADIDRMSRLWNESEANFKAGRISEEQKNQQQEYYHDKAEDLRATLGFSGGDDGSKTIVTNESVFSKVLGIVGIKTPGYAINETQSTIDKIIESVVVPALAPVEETPGKNLNILPFSGYGTMGGSVGSWIDTFKNYMGGTLTDEQARAIAEEKTKVEDRLESLLESDEKIEEQYRELNTYTWLEKNKVWIFGSIVALLGISILDN